MLNQTDKFLDAADKAALQKNADPLAAFFGAKNWSGPQEQTMYVLCTTFRRFAIHQPAQARKLAQTIMENCTIGDGAADGPYVHW
jgi:hypothetical protein